jgi:parallel beta-helix repeat protein
MSDPITWYALGRTVDDPESIMEAIDAKILAHNQDPSAHGQDNESLYEHRVAPLLDHLQYTIYNIKLNPAARVFKAIVSGGGEGDFTTLQAAIDWANLHGGGTVFIKAGTYVQTSDITLYSNITLLGEDDDTTIIDFNNGNHNLRIIGTAGTKKTNIELNNLQIKGSVKIDEGAVYLQYVQDVRILGCYFKDNDTGGAGLSGEIVQELSAEKVRIENCRFNSLVRSISFAAFTNCVLRNCHFQSQPTASELITIGSGSHLIIEGNFFESIRYQAIYCETSPKGVVIYNNTFTTSAGAGHVETIHFDAVTGLKVIGNYIDGNNLATHLISLTSSNRCQIIGNYLTKAYFDGIYLSAADNNILADNVCYSNGRYGINVSGATCDKNIVLGNQCTANTTGGINNAGTNTDLGHNITA